VNKITGERNERGIPSIRFIEDPEDWLSDLPLPIEQIMGALNELHQKYKFMEQQFTRNRQNLKGKLPEIEKTIEVVKHLKRNKDKSESTNTHFCLADNVHVKAEVPPEGNTVMLWLGANIMVEYSYDEAEKLLGRNREQAMTKLEAIQDDMVYLRDQCITAEVNIARIYNYDVRRRREAGEKADAEKKAGAEEPKKAE